ncbi:MAG: FtsA protein [Patescibacteria group bacterium]|nr:FtsA protein [Patescibacteria group bacterium]
MKNTYFYRDKPIFGLSIGFRDVRVMQIKNIDSAPKVQAYGSCVFDPAAIKDGVIEDQKAVINAASDMLKNKIVGKISTRRVAFTIPAARTFGRAVKLPLLTDKELTEAVILEAEQYIPTPIENLYLDHTLIAKSATEIELFAVAAPKKIIDSYVALCQSLDLEVVAIETTIDSASRLFKKINPKHGPTVLVDFGTASVDITILDDVILATGTVSGGGENFTDKISKSLGVTPQEAHTIKSTYGLSYSEKQNAIAQALDPLLDQLFKEIKRMIRYYEERYSTRKKITQIVTMGGGANMPGLTEYMINALRLPVSTTQPWQTVTFSDIQPPESTESINFINVAGVALMPHKEIFK